MSVFHLDSHDSGTHEMRDVVGATVPDDVFTAAVGGDVAALRAILAGLSTTMRQVARRIAEVDEPPPASSALALREGGEDA